LKLVLASRSPRRAELLRAAGIEFTIRSMEIDETPREGELPRDYVLRLAEEKARAVAADESEVVLAADTTVVLGAEIMGKPVDAADATRMIGALAGQKHQVITGVFLKCGTYLTGNIATTDVWMAPMTAAEIADYVASGEPMDKAGAYAIQGLASRFVERINGSYSNVVGLPIALVYGLLRGL
jgi:septum formation protein